MMQDDAASREDEVTEADRSSEVVVDDKLATTTNSGLRARVFVLVSNVVICLVCSASTYGLVWLQASGGQAAWLVIQLGASAVLLGPVGLLSILVAWGPWPVAIRCALLSVALLLLVSTQMLIEYLLISLPFSPYSPTWVSFLNRFSNWFCVLASASLCLAMVGSLRRLRIGPPDLPAIRVTILSIMFATALVGAMISAKMAIDTKFYQEVASSLSDQDIQTMAGSQVISQIAFAGPIAAVMCCVSAAAAFSWWARLGIIALPACFGALSYAQNASISGAGIPNLVVVAAVGTACLVFTCFWIAFCIRLLHRSGWHCSRRIPA